MHALRAAAIILVGILISASPVWGLRCHSRLVTTGDSKFEVVAKCGEPTWIETWHESAFTRQAVLLSKLGPLADFGLTEIIEVEEWTYNFGPHRLIYYLRFENGRLQEIKTGWYGYLD
jgi:hypothetical protein